MGDATQLFGPQLLSRFIEREGLKKGEVAAALGVTRITLFYWLTEASIPEEQARCDVETFSKGEVPRDSWPMRDRRKNPKDVLPFDAQGGDPEEAA